MILLVLLLTSSITGILSKPMRMPLMIRPNAFVNYETQDLFDGFLDDIDPVIRTPHSTRQKAFEEGDNNLLKKETDDEKIVLYNSNNGHFDYMPASQAYLQVQSQPTIKPPWLPYATNTTRPVWTSLGDYIEQSPYFPIQVNVPDMFNAMAQFFTTVMPFLNRWQNPNEPRPYLPHPPYNVPAFHQPLHNFQESVESREDEPITRLFNSENSKKKHQKAGIKVWGSHKPTESKDDFKFKNMPITRKKVRITDREVFNFKNSDISNSPIMIVSMPSRPIYYHRT